MSQDRYNTGYVPPAIKTSKRSLGAIFDAFDRLSPEVRQAIRDAEVKVDTVYLLEQIEEKQLPAKPVVSQLARKMREVWLDTYPGLREHLAERP